MKLVKNLLYNILTLQEKLLRLRLSKTLNSKHKSKRKRQYLDGCVLDLNSMADAEKQALEDELTLILKKYNYSPEEILSYISQTTPVKYLDDAEKKTVSFLKSQEKSLYALKAKVLEKISPTRIEFHQFKSEKGVRPYFEISGFGFHGDFVAYYPEYRDLAEKDPSFFLRELAADQVPADVKKTKIGIKKAVSVLTAFLENNEKA